MGTGQITGSPLTPEQRSTAIRNRFLQVFIGLLIYAVVLFASAGTLAWPAAWSYLGIYALGIIVNGVFLSRANPDVIVERSRAHPNAKAWDRVLSPLISAVGPILVLVVAGLDARNGWAPNVPAWVRIISAAALLVSFLGWAWAMSANRFFSGLVAIQAERDHTVATGGPYRFIRHPGYVAFILMTLATPILLGSWMGLIPGGIACVLIIVRTALEDRTLQAELPGYREYAARVRFRLLPPIW